MKATVAALWALVIVHLARGAFSQINSTQLDQDDDLVPAARLPRSNCGLDDPEFDVVIAKPTKTMDAPRAIAGDRNQASSVCGASQYSENCKVVAVAKK